MAESLAEDEGTASSGEGPQCHERFCVSLGISERLEEFQDAACLRGTFGS